MVNRIWQIVSLLAFDSKWHSFVKRRRDQAQKTRWSDADVFGRAKRREKSRRGKGGTGGMSTRWLDSRWLDSKWPGWIVLLAAAPGI
jgi:hypothetical protein